jgi:hypothetical protein
MIERFGGGDDCLAQLRFPSLDHSGAINNGEAEEYAKVQSHSIS